jgi:hypothetical protein
MVTQFDADATTHRAAQSNEFVVISESGATATSEKHAAAF